MAKIWSFIILTPKTVQLKINIFYHLRFPLIVLVPGSVGDSTVQNLEENQFNFKLSLKSLTFRKLGCFSTNYRETRQTLGPAGDSFLLESSGDQVIR